MQTRSRSILNTIAAHKRQEVATLQQETPLESLIDRLMEVAPPLDFLASLQESPFRPSLIAEVKKASPSKGVIRADFDPVAIAKAYEKAGAACLSVLTDNRFFQGSFDYLEAIRREVGLPLLCKEFIIDPYQIYLARTRGADAILLIVALLSDRELALYLDVIAGLGMTALVEVHTAEELDRALELVNLRLLGINNRNLKDFSVSLTSTEQLMSRGRTQIEAKDLTMVSESGLYTRADLDLVASYGCRAVLVGESLVKQPQIEPAVTQLLTGV